MNEYVVQDYADLIRLRSEKFDPGKFYCFRGHSDESWDLVPAFYRGLTPPVSDVDDGHWLGEVERDVYREFTRFIPRFAGKEWVLQDKWHLLFLAQHYGVPTRLLDWTRSLTIATYFAVTKNLGKDANIWCVNVSDFTFPKELGRLAKNRGFRLEALKTCVAIDEPSFFSPQSKSIIATTSPAQATRALPSDQSGSAYYNGFLAFLEPPVLEDRIKNQQGLFSVYISNDDYDFVWNQREYIEIIEQHYSTELLSKIIIPQNSKLSIKTGLENEGVDPHHIFPDLEGLVMLVNQQRDSSFDYFLNERKKWIKSP